MYRGVCISIAFLAYTLTSTVLGCSRFQTSELQDNFQLFDYALAKFKIRTEHQCMQLCFSWILCRSITYNKLRHRCNLNCKTHLETHDSNRWNSDFIYTDIHQYSSVVAGKCQYHDCPYNRICVPNIADGYTCQPILIDADKIEKLHDLYFDFEFGLCGWGQEKNDDGDWFYMDADDYQSADRGDHTHGNGRCLCLDVSHQDWGDSIRLISDEIPENKHILFSFWYRIWEGTPASVQSTLNLFIKVGNSSEELLFSTSYPNKLKWLYEEMFIKARAEPLVVVFEAVRGSGGAEDICIDDVSIDVIV